MAPGIDSLIESINSIDQNLLQGHNDARVRLLHAAQALCIRLETPWDFVQRVTWQEVADDTGLFKHVGPEGSPPKSVEELAQATSVDPVLLKRISRHLAARHVLRDSSDPSGKAAQGSSANSSAVKDSLGSYSATHISAALATAEGSSGIRHASQLYFPNFLAMPDYLKTIGYVVPRDNRDGPFQRRHGLVGSTTFEALQRPEFAPLAADFNRLMKFTTQGRRSFLDVCDVASLLHARPFRPSSPSTEEHGESAGKGETGHLFVDVGGGTGSDAVAFRRQFPVNDGWDGEVELQELPAVIEAARAAGVGTDTDTSGAGSVWLRSHDFFSERQPVRGPRFFFMGSVLHDWPDADAARILRPLADAMRPGYSTLLLSENVLPDSDGSATGGCHPHMSAIDLTMMTSLASGERSEADWRRLLAGAGLRLVKIHTIPSCLKSVLECELQNQY